MRRFWALVLVMLMAFGGLEALALNDYGSVNELEQYSDFWLRYPEYRTLDGSNSFASGSAYRACWTTAMRLCSAGTQTYRVTNCSEWVSVRAEADTTSERLSVAYLGEEIEVNGRWKDWYLCVFDETENGVLCGWVLAQFLTPVSIWNGGDGFFVSGGSASENMYVVNCQEWVSLRALADTSSVRLKKVPFGACVRRCRVLGNGFTMCEYGGATGYILSQYLSVQQPFGSRMYVVNCDEWVSLRQYADTSARRLAKVPLGGAVVLINVLDNGFAQCEYAGQRGYILSEYLATVPAQVDVRVMYVVNCDEWVSLRQYADKSAPRLAKVPLGSRVELCEILANGFARCVYGGQTGYILTEYLASHP